MRWIDGLAALAIACLAAYLAVQPPLRDLQGTAFDLLLRAREEIYGPPARPPGGAPVVVVALDRETALRAPFDRLPPELWTPQLATVMDRVLAGGARLVAQHEAFAVSGERLSEGYDAAYLELLARAGKEGRLVLGRRAPAPDRLGPLPAYVEAVGGGRNVRRIALHADGDGVLRRAALYENSRESNGTVSLNPSLALELASRVVGERPHLLDGDSLMLGRYAVPGSEDNAMLLNFRGGGIPLFSLGDLYACAEAGDETFFRKHFDNRVVLFGRSDVPRSRRVTAARFLATGGVGRAAERCRLPAPADPTGSDRPAATPEVVVTATAVDNLLQRDAVKSLPDYAAALVSGLLAMAAAFAVLRLSPLLSTPGVPLVLAGWAFLSVVLLARQHWLLPLAQPFVAVVLAVAAAWAWRAVKGLRPRFRFR